MAIGTPTNKITSAGSIANSGSYNTAAVILDADKWYTLQTSSYGATSHTVSSVVHNPAGTPLNFTLVSDGTTSARNQNWDAALHRVVEVWAVRPASTTASAIITITFSGTQSAACWSLTEWATGVDPTAFATKVTTSVDAGAGTTASLTMAAFANSVNATLWVVALGTGTADPAENILIGESRTELTEIDDAERSQHAVHYQNPNGNDTTLTATWTNAEEWGTIGIEVKALTASLITDSDTGTLTDNRSLTGEAVPIDTGSFTDNHGLTADMVNADEATISEVGIANLTQNAVSTDSLTVTETESASQTAGPSTAVDTDTGTLTDVAAAALQSVAADNGTLTDACQGTLAAITADQGTTTETSAIGTTLINADIGTMAETQSASQAGTGGGPAADSESAALVEQAIAQLLASIGDIATATDISSPVGFLVPIESASFTEIPAGVAALVTVDAGALSESEIATGPAPIGSDSDAFTFGDDAVVSYRFPPLNRGTRLHRHGSGTWLHAR